MQIQNTKKGFTLVELIVVITILAILGGIAFVSFSSWSANARNSTRVQEVNQLRSQVGVQTSSGISILSLVTGNAAQLATINLAWNLNLTTGNGLYDDFYRAGDINFSALDTSSEEYLDPSFNLNYPMGATTLGKGGFEIAATMEDENGGNYAYVTGDWSSRDTTAQTITAVSTGDSTITLDSTAIGFFAIDDYIQTASASTAYQITDISSNGQILTINTTIVAGDNGDTTLALNVADTAGLIDNTGSTGPVVDGSTTSLPYQ